MIKYLIILSVFSLNLSVLAENIPIPAEFLKALSKIESSNNEKAYNRGENAIGIYQIREKYFIDAAQYDKSLAKYTHNDCFDKQISSLVVKAYFNRYAPDAVKNRDWETLARLHNSGPNWKTKKNKTEKYWQKIRKE